MDFGLQVELDTNCQGGSLQVAVVVDGALEQVACRILSIIVLYDGRSHQER